MSGPSHETWISSLTENGNPREIFVGTVLQTAALCCCSQFLWLFRAGGAHYLLVALAVRVLFHSSSVGARACSSRVCRLRDTSIAGEPLRMYVPPPFTWFEDPGRVRLHIDYVGGKLTACSTTWLHVCT